MKKVLFFLILAGMAMPQSAIAQTRGAIRMSPRQAIMEYAKRGNIQKLKELKVRYNIDTSDAKGNSALCEAVWRKDKNAVATLAKAGANLNNECMKKIPPEYKQAVGIRSVGAQGTVSGTQAAGTATGATGVAASEAGLSTGAMVGIGVGAAALIGGGVALAAGGGGGGSSSSTPTPAVCSGHGTQDEEGNCICNEGWVGDTCDTPDPSCTGFEVAVKQHCATTTSCKYGDHTLHTHSSPCCVPSTHASVA